MNRGIYATATGMIATQRWMDVTANNLANASTTGFKKDEIVFGEALQNAIFGGMNKGTIGTMGSGPMNYAEFTNFERGAIQRTSNPLDLAINSDKGAFAVQTPSGVRYTRDGSFQLDDQNRIVTPQGFPLLDDSGSEITLSAQGKIAVQADGTIAVDGNAERQKIGIFDGTFTKDGSNMLASADAKAVTDESITIEPQSLETSNVNAIQSMIDMVTIGRSFDMAQRSIQQQDELTQKLIQSLQGN